MTDPDPTPVVKPPPIPPPPDAKPPPTPPTGDPAKPLPGTGAA